MQRRLFHSFFKTGSKNQQFDGEAQILSWRHDRLNPGRHLALIMGDLYISLTPKVKQPGGVFRKYEGVESYFVTKVEADHLIHGYRHLSSQQDESRLRKMTEYEILQEVLGKPDDLQTQARKLGKPEIIHLRNLDLASMIKKWQELKAAGIKYALLSGPDCHTKNSYNCSGLILEILRAGRIYNKISTHREHALGALCATMIGIGLHCFTNKSPYMQMALALSGYLLGRGIARGIPGSQYYIDYEKSRGMNSWFYFFLIRAFFTLAASIKECPLILTNPQHVIDIAHEACRYDAAQSHKIGAGNGVASLTI